MFEREVKFITDISLNNIKKLGSFFTLEQLSNSKIHPAITQYISAEIDYLIYSDRQRLLQKSNFDYSGAEIAKHFEAIAIEIKKNKLIPFEEVKMRVQRAVNFNVNFLLRPYWTIRKFIFDSEDIRSAEEINLFLNYGYFYDYYKQYFHRILQKKSLLSLSSNEFSERFIVFRKEIISSQFELYVDDTLTSIAEFLNMGESVKDRIAAGSVELFLKDSELMEYTGRLRNLFASDPKQKYLISDIKEALLSNIPSVRTIEIQEDEVSSQSGVELNEFNENELSIDSLFLEGPVTPISDEPAVQTQEEIIAEEAKDESEADVSSQITELLTTQLLVEEHHSSILDDSQTEKTFDGVQAETLLAEIKAAREALTSDSETTIKETEPETENIESIELNETEVEEPETAQETEDLDFQAFDAELADIEAAIENIDEDADSETINDEELENGEQISEEEDSESSDFIESLQEDDTTENEPEVQEEIIPEEPPIIEEEVEEEESELFRYFSTKETMRIIKEIFNTDQIDFVTTIEKIANCANFDQASLILKSVFYSYRINPLTNKDAKLLEDRIQRYFTEREQI